MPSQSLASQRQQQQCLSRKNNRFEIVSRYWDLDSGLAKQLYVLLYVSISPLSTLDLQEEAWEGAIGWQE